jgi:hypothetical protein
MKTKDFDSFHHFDARDRKQSRREPHGLRLSAALMGLACGLGVFGLLTLLYHFG